MGRAGTGGRLTGGLGGRGVLGLLGLGVLVVLVLEVAQGVSLVGFVLGQSHGHPGRRHRRRGDATSEYRKDLDRTVTVAGSHSHTSHASKNRPAPVKARSVQGQHSLKPLM